MDYVSLLKKDMKSKYLIILILIVGLFLRFYKLGSIPNGLYQDETAIGYNAYSILTTGKDEYGKSLPLYFKSFGDYKLPVYIYATVPAIKIFGMTPFAVRFPSALFGFLTIPLFYLLVFKLSKNNNLALTAAGLLAINPWHIHYSRAAFEVSISLFFFLLGTFWLVNPKKGYFLLGTLCFIIAFYSYNLTRLLAPLLYIVVNYSLYPKIRKNEILLTTLISFILLLPFFISFTALGGLGSSRGTLIFTSAVVQAPLLEFRSYMTALPVFFTKLFFNTPILTLWQYIQNIASYLSVPFFFLSGSTHGNHGIGTVGQFYLFELPVMVIGAYIFLQQKTMMSRLLFSWLILTVAVASLTREAPHATRSFFLLFPLIVLSAQGLLYWKKLLPLIGLCAIWFISSYFIRFPIAYAKQWRSADYEVSMYIKNHEHEYDKILIDKNAGFIYTSYLFYSSYPPAEFQQIVRRLPNDAEGFSEVISIGKIEFRDINWETDIQIPRTLIITSENKPSNIPAIETFYYPKRPVVIAHKQKLLQYPVEEIAYVAVETTPSLQK